MDWTGVDYLWIIVMFLSSCLDSHSDGTHSLQRIHWWTNNVMLHFSKSNEETNSSTSWMTWGRGWAHFQQMFIFGWTPLLIHVTLHTHSSFKTRRRPQKLLNGYKCHHLICDIFETFLSQSFIWQMYRNHCFHIYIYISFFSCYCFTVKCIGWICPLKHDNTFIYLLQMYSVMVHSN